MRVSCPASTAPLPLRRPNHDRAEAAESEVSTLKGRIAELEAGLEPFGKHDWTDENGWNDLACKNDRICDWFGPSDFRRARRLTHQEKNNAG